MTITATVAERSDAYVVQARSRCRRIRICHSGSTSRSAWFRTSAQWSATPAHRDWCLPERRTSRRYAASA